MNDGWCVIAFADRTGIAIPMREIIRIDFGEFDVVSIQTATYTEEVDSSFVHLGVDANDIPAIINAPAGCRLKGDANEEEHQPEEERGQEAFDVAECEARTQGDR